LTPEIEKKILDAIRIGNYYEAACAYAGINIRTFYRWMEKGEKAKSGEFCQFCHAVKQAEGDAEARIVAQWTSKTPEDWRAAQAFLEHRYPERWGKRIKIAGDQDAPLILKTWADVVKNLSEREKRKAESDNGGPIENCSE